MPILFSRNRQRPWEAIDLFSAFQILSFPALRSVGLSKLVGFPSFEIILVLYRLVQSKISLPHAFELRKHVNKFVAICRIFVWCARTHASVSPQIFVWLFYSFVAIRSLDAALKGLLLNGIYSGTGVGFGALLLYRALTCQHGQFFISCVYDAQWGAWLISNNQNRAAELSCVPHLQCKRKTSFEKEFPLGLLRSSNISVSQRCHGC